MADYITSTDLAEVEAIQAADDEDSGLPVLGRHVGRGRHVAMDPEDPTSPGWTVHRVGITKHPERDEWALPIRDDLEERLTGKVPANVIAKLKSRAPLDPDWTPPGLS